MKKQAAKIVVRPHYIGGKTRSEMFRRILADEVQRKLKLREITANSNK